MNSTLGFVVPLAMFKKKMLVYFFAKYMNKEEPAKHCKNLLSKVFVMTVLFFLQVHSVHQVIPVRVMGKASPIDRYIIVEGELVILSFYAQI